ncbi:MAG TPA: nucleotide exchange factor GrpE [Cyclobacteriaceae bacterium]|jgi:molecular chaperone GrpE
MSEEKMEKNPSLDQKGNSETQVEDEKIQDKTPENLENAPEPENVKTETSREEAEDESEKLSKELTDAKDKYLRLFSEFENFRRRTARERLDLIQTSTEGLMVELLPVLDDFGRAAASIENGSDKKSVAEGIQLIENKFKRALEQKGLKAMQVKQGDDFNPELHEAVSQIPAPKKKLVGKIIETVEDGYFLGEKVIRFAKVVIGG